MDRADGGAAAGGRPAAGVSVLEEPSADSRQHRRHRGDLRLGAGADPARVGRARRHRPSLHRCRLLLLSVAERLLALCGLRFHRAVRSVRAVHPLPQGGREDPAQRLRSGMAMMPMLIALALSMTPSWAVQEPQMAVQLLFDGKPLQTTAPPQFSCRDDNRNIWIGCTVTSEPGTNRFLMDRPAPGIYTLHVEIDENQDNPARFP